MGPIWRVREALRVLELDSSRDVRRQLQALLKSWDIKQKDPSNKKRSVVDLHMRLRAAVLKEGNRLRTMVSFSSQAGFETLFRSSAAQRAARTALHSVLHGPAVVLDGVSNNAGQLVTRWCEQQCWTTCYRDGSSTRRRLLGEQPVC